MKSATIRNLFKKKFSSSGSTARYDKPSHPFNATKLGPDMLIIIFDLIQTTSPKSLQALSLVSWNFYHLATYARLRTLRLSLGSSKLQASHDRLKYAESHDLLSAISTLEVIDSSSQSYNTSDPSGATFAEYQQFLQYLANLMPMMTGLKVLDWNYSSHSHKSIPDCVLEALRSCPKMQLRARAGLESRYHDTAHESSNLEKLQGNANLSHFDVGYTFYGAEDCLKVTQPLKCVLVSSPGIRSLTIDIHQPTGGCCVYSPPNEYCGMGFVGDESMPPLKELILHQYPWGSESNASASGPLSWFQQNGYPGKGTEMDYWAENFDWSSLQRLETSYVGFAIKIMPKLTSLREVTFSSTHPQEDIIRFYQECPAALESIGVQSLSGITLEGILRHGTKLRKLRIHTVEHAKWFENAMDVESLRAIRDKCPLIEDLYIDIPRSGDWPWEHLDILASFPNLRNLTVCFELGVKYDGNPVEPYVTFSSVRTLFTYLHSHRPANQLTKITRLHIYSGAPPDIGFGYPSPDAFWPEHNSTEFICTLAERDDHAAQGLFDIVCPKIPKDLDEDKQRREKPDPHFEAMKHFHQSAVVEATRVANKGPTKRSEWQAHY